MKETPIAAQSKSSKKVILIWTILAAVVVIALAAFYFSRPPLPVVLTYRPADAGGSWIAQFRTRSATSIKFLVVIKGQTGQSKQDELVVEPSGLVEIGPAQGWHIAKGDTIRIHNLRYRDICFPVPPPPKAATPSVDIPQDADAAAAALTQDTLNRELKAKSSH